MDPTQILGQMLNDQRVKAVLSIDELINCGLALRDIKQKLEAAEATTAEATTAEADR